MAALSSRHRLVVGAMLLLAVAADAKPTVHTVIPTECKNYFSWQSLGMFYSHRKVGQPGPMTRILCCTKEDYDKLSETEKNLVPTHVAPSYTVHPRTGDVYHAYNKPLAVIDWLAKNDIKEDYILVIDADMIMREPFLPDELGARPGWAVAAYFGYMKGTDNQLALTHVPEVVPRNDTLAGRRGRRGDMAGGFTLMHREDMRRVAPLWLKYTEAVREDVTAWNLTGDEFAKKPGDKPWISEMYGYSFGCSKADVWHITHSEHMLYPGYDTVDPPKVLHYGLLWKVKGTSYEFDKHWHFDFDPLVCPPWDLSTDPRKTKKGLFAHPPSPKDFKTKEFDLLRDLLSVEPIIILNAAFCERHLRVCPQSEELQRECSRAHQLELELDEAYATLQLPDPCVNRAKECEWWASVGECEKTAGWMYSHCRLACKWCTPRDQQIAPPTTKVGDGQVQQAKQQQQQQQLVTAQGQGTAATGDAIANWAQKQQQRNEQQQQEQQQQGYKAQRSDDRRAAQRRQEGAAAGRGRRPDERKAAEEGAGGMHAARARQQQQQRNAAMGRGMGGQRGAAAGGGGGDAVLDQHLVSMTKNGGVQGKQGLQAAGHMPFVSGEVHGVQAMLSHHIQMLAVFWGAVLVAVLFKMRRRLLRRPHAARHR